MKWAAWFPLHYITGDFPLSVTFFFLNASKTDTYCMHTQIAQYTIVTQLS